MPNGSKRCEEMPIRPKCPPRQDIASIEEMKTCGKFATALLLGVRA